MTYEERIREIFAENNYTAGDLPIQELLDLIHEAISAGYNGFTFEDGCLEGIVIKSIGERETGPRAALKLVSDRYLERA